MAKLCAWREKIQAWLRDALRAGIVTADRTAALLKTELPAGAPEPEELTHRRVACVRRGEQPEAGVYTKVRLGGSKLSGSDFHFLFGAPSIELDASENCTNKLHTPRGFRVRRHYNWCSTFLIPSRATSFPTSGAHQVAKADGPQLAVLSGWLITARSAGT
jgi:hypothetical protein